MSVYENFNVNTVDLSYRGCFSDPADSRVFFQGASSDAMTAEVRGRVMKGVCSGFLLGHVDWRRFLFSCSCCCFELLLGVTVISFRCRCRVVIDLRP